MIKVGIIGAETPDAGELLRLLINHPEVDITSLYSPAWAGRMVASRHHGFIGEEIVNFSERFNTDAIDIAFIADDSEIGNRLISDSATLPELRIVYMGPARLERAECNGMEYGLSEVNRKPLVRGARLAVVPSHAASLALIALYPLALNLLLNSDIEIAIEATPKVIESIDLKALDYELSSFLQKTQNSFIGKIHFTLKSCEAGRSMKVACFIKSSLSIAEVNKVYDSVYDDHNFTFISLSEVNRLEVEGTHKCIVTIQKPGAGLLEVSVLGDCYLRGGAGDAVHIMNLFFALDEKVGLHLKPACFDAVSDDKSVSWFA